MSVRKIFIWFSLLVIIGALVIWFVYNQTSSADELDISINAPDSVEIGVPFTAKMSVHNAGNGIMREMSLAVSLPDGLVFMSEPETKRVLTRTVGTLGEGSVTNQEYRIMPVGSDNSILELKATASYVPTNLGSRFEKTAVKNLSVGLSGLSLDIAAPQKVFSGELFDIDITYKNISQTEFIDIFLKLDYPKGFSLVNASLETSEGNNVWDLGDLRPNSEAKLFITGTLSGPDNAFFDIKAALSSTILGKSYPVNIKTASLSISPSPLSLRIDLNDRQDYVAETDDGLNYRLTYKNNTDIALKDVIIKAKLIGTMFDLSQIEAVDGIYRSSDGSILWNASRKPSLALLQPGAEESVRFSVKTKDSFPIRRISDKNFTLKVVGEIESPTVPYNVTSDRTVGAVSLETRLKGDIVPSVTGAHKDSVQFASTGSLPPQVGKPITFTMHWILKNTATDVDNVAMKSFLGPNVHYTGLWQATNNVAPTYNERTQELIWQVGSISATKGTIGQPTELAFQVELIPSSNQINQFPVLVGETTITADDAFTGTAIFDKVPQFTTLLLSDRTATAQEGRVMP